MTSPCKCRVKGFCCYRERREKPLPNTFKLWIH
nr:MAG TPA: hypothetical protein [Bacteriophage sp.]